MKFMSKKLALAGFLGMAVVPSANAGEWSLTAFGGQSSSSVVDGACRAVTLQTNIQFSIRRINERVRCNADDTDSALGLNIAYNISDAWGFELGYVDLGEYTLKLSGVEGLGDITVDAKAPYTAVVGTLPLSDNVSVSGRLGIFRASGDVASTRFNITEEIAGDAQGYAGVSLNYKFTKKVSAQLRYDNFDEFDIAGLGIKFGF